MRRAHTDLATRWELLPPARRIDEPPASCDQQADFRWVERFPSLTDLADRVIDLAWGVFGGTGAEVAGQSPTFDAARHRDLLNQARAGEADEAALRTLQGHDLHLIVPREATGKDAPPRQMWDVLRVRGLGEREPVLWHLHPEVVAAVGARSRGLTLHHRLFPRGEAAAAVAPIGDPGKILVEDHVLKATVSAMLRRRLVLLAGVSGSGKTQIAKRLGKAWAAGLFKAGMNQDGHPISGAVSAILKSLKDARVIGDLLHVKTETKTKTWWPINELQGWSATARRTFAAEVSRRFGFIAVRSDWTDASHLWGYHVPLPVEAEGFYGTEALRVFLQANADYRRNGHSTRCCLLLDEMNLSRPEHYGSDLLSAMELTLGRDDAADVIQLHRAGRDVRLRGASAGSHQPNVPQRIGWPDGMLVIGTVNVDETTFSFAPKVLDRAALLEFVDVDLNAVIGSGTMGDEAKKAYSDNKEWIDGLNKILKSCNLHLGYRAAKEVLTAITLADNGQHACDEQLRNKVLPRIRGPLASVKALLFDLRDFAENSTSDPSARSAHLRALAEGKEGTLSRESRSVVKIDEMLRRASTIGFTSFFG